MDDTACTLMFMADMDEKDPKAKPDPRDAIQFALGKNDSDRQLRAAIDVLTRAFPGIKKASDLNRKIYELGMFVLAAQPDWLQVSTTPTPEQMEASPAMQKAKAQAAAMGPESFIAALRLSAGMPDVSAGPVQRAKDSRVDRAKEKPKGPKRPGSPRKSPKEKSAEPFNS